MEKYKIGLINSLNQSLEKNEIEKKIHEKIMESAELVKPSSKPIIIAEWCFNAMSKMDELLEDDIKQKIREDCACCLGGKQKKLCTEVNKNYISSDERINAINESHSVFGHEIKVSGKGKYEVKFHEETLPEYKCVCSHFKLNGLNKKWSKTWCYCCAGHVKHHLETLLGKQLKVKVISSALSSIGKKNCHFELKEI
jgi:hypothetical protein